MGVRGGGCIRKARACVLWEEQQIFAHLDVLSNGRSPSSGTAGLSSIDFAQSSTFGISACSKAFEWLPKWRRTIRTNERIPTSPKLKFTKLKRKINFSLSMWINPQSNLSMSFNRCVGINPMCKLSMGINSQCNLDNKLKCNLFMSLNWPFNCNY